MTGDVKPIVVVGSINMDLVASAEHIPSVGETIEGKGFQFLPGGKGAYRAVAVAKLGYPIPLSGYYPCSGLNPELLLVSRCDSVP